MKKIWRNNNKIVVNDNRLALCGDCPCCIKCALFIWPVMHYGISDTTGTACSDSLLCFNTGGVFFGGWRELGGNGSYTDFTDDYIWWDREAGLYRPRSPKDIDLYDQYPDGYKILAFTWHPDFNMAMKPDHSFWSVGDAPHTSDTFLYKANQFPDLLPSLTEEHCDLSVDSKFYTAGHMSFPWFFRVVPAYNAETMMATVGTELDQVTQQILMYPNYIYLERLDGYVYPDNDLRTAAGIESGVLYKHPLCEGYSFKVVYDMFKFLARREDNKKWYNLGLRMDDPFVEQWIALEITIYDPDGVPIECPPVNIDPGIPPFEVFEPAGSSSGSGSDSGSGSGSSSGSGSNSGSGSSSGSGSDSGSSSGSSSGSGSNSNSGSSSNSGSNSNSGGGSSSGSGSNSSSSSSTTSCYATITICIRNTETGYCHHQGTSVLHIDEIGEIEGIGIANLTIGGERTDIDGSIWSAVEHGPCFHSYIDAVEWYHAAHTTEEWNEIGENICCGYVKVLVCQYDEMMGMIFYAVQVLQVKGGIKVLYYGKEYAIGECTTEMYEMFPGEYEKSVICITQLSPIGTSAEANAYDPGLTDEELETLCPGGYAVALITGILSGMDWYGAYLYTTIMVFPDETPEEAYGRWAAEYTRYQTSANTEYIGFFETMDEAYIFIEAACAACGGCGAPKHSFPPCGQ